MNDPRITALAGLLVRYSLAVRPRDTVGVEGTSSAEPLILAVYEEIVRAGAFPLIRMQPAGAAEILFKFGQPHHFRTIPAWERAYARTVTSTISILSAPNTRALSNADPARHARLALARRAVSRVLLGKPWTLTLFPTHAYAQDAEMSLREFEDYFYAAAFADADAPAREWRNLGRYQQRLIHKLQGAQTARIVGTDTDLAFSIAGRPFVSSDGRRNMPSGEIFTAPREHSAEGFISFEFPACHGGRLVEGVRLAFRRGEVVEASATKGGEFLSKMLDVDLGAKRLGEFGIGTNPRLDKFTKCILLDEKIAGTVHLALGRSPAGTGGTNKSAIHWDMIKDLRSDGAIYLDGRPFISGGKICG